MSFQMTDRTQETIFARWLNDNLDRTGIRISVLAEHVGVSIPYLSMLKNGRRARPAPHVVDALAMAFGASLEEARRAAGLLPHSFRPTIKLDQDSDQTLNQTVDRDSPSFSPRFFTSTNSEQVSIDASDDSITQIHSEPSLSSVKMWLRLAQEETVHRRILLQAMESAIVCGRLSTPPCEAIISELPHASDTDKAVELLHPVATRVRSERPVLQWRSLPTCSSFRVTVTDSQGAQVASAGNITGYSWQLPHSLTRGHVYRWSVSARLDGKIINSQAHRFQILPEASLGLLQHIERDCENLPVMLSVGYALVGLFDDAEKQLQSILSQKPDCPLTASWHANLQANRVSDV